VGATAYGISTVRPRRLLALYSPCFYLLRVLRLIEKSNFIKFDRGRGYRKYISISTNNIARGMVRDGRKYAFNPPKVRFYLTVLLILS
jgi:hypothetical protein